MPESFKPPSSFLKDIELPAPDKKGSAIPVPVEADKPAAPAADFNLPFELPDFAAAPLKPAYTPASREPRKRPLQKFVNIVFYTVLISFLLISVIYGMTAGGMAGRGIFGISMRPVDNEVDGRITAGSLVVTVKINPDRLSEGDIVSYRNMDTTETGRYDGLFPDGKLNIKYRDNIIRPVEAKELLGRKIIAIPALGDFMLFIGSGLYVYISIMVATVAVMLMLKLMAAGPKKAK